MTTREASMRLGRQKWESRDSVLCFEGCSGPQERGSVGFPCWLWSTHRPAALSPLLGFLPRVLWILAQAFEQICAQGVSVCCTQSALKLKAEAGDRGRFQLLLSCWFLIARSPLHLPSWWLAPVGHPSPGSPQTQTVALHRLHLHSCWELNLVINPLCHITNSGSYLQYSLFGWNISDTHRSLQKSGSSSVWRLGKVWDGGGTS